MSLILFQGPPLQRDVGRRQAHPLRRLHQRDPVRPPFRHHRRLLLGHHEGPQQEAKGEAGEDEPVLSQGRDREDKEPEDQQDAHLHGRSLRLLLAATQLHQLPGRSQRVRLLLLGVPQPGKD